MGYLFGAVVGASVSKCRFSTIVSGSCVGGGCAVMCVAGWQVYVAFEHALCASSALLSHRVVGSHGRRCRRLGAAAAQLEHGDRGGQTLVAR